MLRRITRRAVAACAAAATVAGVGAVPAAQAVTSTSYSGTTSDGATWIADVPTSWNGILLLYSHGFGPTVAADAPDAATKDALLERGYALVGSSYDPQGSWWALDSALKDQFETLTDVRPDLPAAPKHVIAVGTSMGGLVSALEDENSNGRLDGALTTCGIVAGAIQLNNYQLDGEYAMNRLLAPSQSIKLVHFSGPGDGLNTGYQFDQIAQQAQTTSEGRARLALAMAFMNVSTWAPGEPMPAAGDYAAQERQQFKVQFKPAAPPISTTMDFVEFGRPWIEQAAGGNGSWTMGVNFRRLLAHSSYAPEVIRLYHDAGLNLRRDLDVLTRDANISADANAIQSLQQTSVPTGRLQVPELDMHTISDQLVPVQQENYYRQTVTRAGARDLLRQAFVQRQLHCNFTPAELVSGLLAVQQRIETHHWGDVTDPDQLNARAATLGLGDSAFIRYRPAPLSGNNGPFATNPDRTWR